MKNTLKKWTTMILAVTMAANGMIAFVSAAGAEETNNEVYGDLNCDGIADITDLSGLSLYLIGDRVFDEAALKNADVNRDGKVDLSDLAAFKMHLSKQAGSAVNAENKGDGKTAGSFEEFGSKYSKSNLTPEDGPLYDKINEQAEKLRANDRNAAEVEAKFGKRRPVSIFRPLNYADKSLLDVYMAVFESKIEPEVVSNYMFDMTTGEQISISDIFGDSFSEFDGEYEIAESNRDGGYVILRNYSDYYDCIKAEYDFSTLNPKYSSFADFQSMDTKYEEHELICYTTITISGK